MRTRMGIGIISLLAVQTIYAADTPIGQDAATDPSFDLFI